MASVAGTTIFACAKPVKPGVKPRKFTVALVPPMVAVAVAVALERGEPGAAVPVGHGIVQRALSGEIDHQCCSRCYRITGGVDGIVDGILSNRMVARVLENPRRAAHHRELEKRALTATARNVHVGGPGREITRHLEVDLRFAGIQQRHRRLVNVDSGAGQAAW